MLRRLLPLACLSFSAALLAAEPDARALLEIEHLLGFLEGSSCSFNRNGNWYAASVAAKHIRGKYDYVRDKGLVGSAEDFIEYAATDSSLSGVDYQVRCAEAEPITSAEWLNGELARWRAENPRR